MTKKQALPKETSPLFVIIHVLLLLVWVGGAMYAVQFILARITLIIVGANITERPSALAWYFILSDLLTASVIILFPKFLLPRLIPQPVINKPSKKKLSKKAWWKEIAHELGLKDLPTWSDIGLALVSYIAYLILALILTSFFNIFPWFNSNEAQNVGFGMFMSKPELILAFFSTVVITPIIEEMIFRGFLYGKLREVLAGKISNLASIIISVVLTSALFGLMHGQWNVGVDVFGLSVILCLLREITGTIHAGILLHILKNGIAFYLVFVLGAGLL